VLLVNRFAQDGGGIRPGAFFFLMTAYDATWRFSEQTRDVVFHS